MSNNNMCKNTLQNCKMLSRNVAFMFKMLCKNTEHFPVTLCESIPSIYV